MTTSAGAPIEKRDTYTLNKRLLLSPFFMDALTHLVREKIPARVVHAKGAGAFGYLELTHDITDVCKAKLFSEVGKRTPVAVRFSLGTVDQGGPDTFRDQRGFAIKFYTEHGNFDILGLSTPVFFCKDPILFMAIQKARARNSVTNLYDPITFWDFVTLHPESSHVILYLFGDTGIIDGYSYMPGFSIHTYQVVSNHGETYFIRFHFMPDKGIKTFSSEDGKKIAADDPDYNTRSLYNAIGTGDFPSWTASIQVLTLDDVKTAGFNIFDVTKVLPLFKYPLRPFGRLVLNKNPVNYFADIEQLAFNPANLVPGILGAPDKLFESRTLAYRDAEYYRLGSNFNNIGVNCPLRKPLTYNRDGTPPVEDNMQDVPNYYPNSFNGPVPYEDKNAGELIKIYEDEEPNNFEQSRDHYLHDMSSGEKKRLINNIVDSLRPIPTFIQVRAVQLFKLIYPDLGNRIQKGLQTNKTIVENCS